MDLSYGSEYEAFRQDARRFIETHAQLAPKGLEPDREKTPVWQKLLIENGYAARAVPKEYGGHGAAGPICDPEGEGAANFKPEEVRAPPDPARGNSRIARRPRADDPSQWSPDRSETRRPWP